MTQPPDLATPLVQELARHKDAPNPLHPEAAFSAFMGMVWPGVLGDRDEAMTFFSLVLADQLKTQGAKARPVLELLATQAPAEVADQIADQAAHTLGPVPAWVPMLRDVRFLGAFSSTDLLGRQENFILHFDYGPDVGGNHILIALVDRPLGIIKDAFLVGPDGTFQQLLVIFGSNPDLVVDERITAEYIAAQILPAMHGTKELDDLDILGEETVEAWHLLESRMRACFDLAAPVLTGPERTQLVNRFLNRVATKRLAEHHGFDRRTLRLLVRAIVDFENEVSDGGWDQDEVTEFIGGWLPEQGLDEEAEDVIALINEWSKWRDSL